MDRMSLPPPSLSMVIAYSPSLVSKLPSELVPAEYYKHYESSEEAKQISVKFITCFDDSYSEDEPERYEFFSTDDAPEIRRIHDA